MSKMMVIDGNSIINRAFYGVGHLSNREGTPTGAIFGFLNIYFKYLEEEQPEFVSIAFDLKAPTFRHKQFADYKANRKGMPDELALQLPILKEILALMNIKTVEKEGYEADDILGTLSKMCESENMECVLVTGDRDSLQLVSANTTVKLPSTSKSGTKTEHYTVEKIFEQYKLSPADLIEVKALMGDKSDNIPGVRGVGDKTAIDLIQRYNTVENLYANIETAVLKPSIRKTLEQNKDMAFLSKQLARIDVNAPIDVKIDDCKLKDFDKAGLLELFKKLEFKSFIQKLDLLSINSQTPVRQAASCNTVMVADTEELAAFIEQIERQSSMTYILFHINNDVFICLHVQDTAVFVNLPIQVALKELKPVLENQSIKKTTHNVKSHIVFLNSHMITLRGIDFDCMIASYIVNPQGVYSIEQLALEYLDRNISSHQEIFGKKQISMEDVDGKSIINLACECASGQVSVLNDLRNILDTRLTDCGQHELYYDIELPLAEVLASMEIIGFKVDRQQLTDFSTMLTERVTGLEKNIYSLANESFNINSPKQLGVILFEKLGLPVVKRTKTGYSTDVEVLEKLRGGHPIIEQIMEYRQLSKLKSTYADGLLAVINPNTGKIHSSFNQTVTATGRISSTEPNLQNIPIKLDLGREIRKMFVAESDEYILTDADYSQIELRVLAHIAGDPTMIKAFKKKEDIHTSTAAAVFGIQPESVNAVMRSRAKAVNFGIVYGIGDYSLAQDLGITRKEAKKYIESYLNKYSLVKEYMHNIVEYGKQHGYVSTLFNRRRYLPELTSTNFTTRSFGERVAMNTPIQGSAADIIKIAMVNVYKSLSNMKSRLILQVHDELIVETHKSEIEQVQNILKQQMENAVKLKVKLKVDMNYGSSWYDAKG